jgi:tetratricopeptide (TPR) repeat protein
VNVRIARFGLILAVLIAVVSPAAAEDKVAARAAFTEGTKHYDLNQYEQALEAFKRAYWNYEEPTFLFNIAQCHRALGRKEEALAFYRSYLRKLPDAPNRLETERFMTELEEALAHEKVVREEIKPNVPAVAVVDTTPPPPPAPAKKPAWKRGWVWGVVAAGVVITLTGSGVRRFILIYDVLAAGAPGFARTLPAASTACAKTR